MSKLFQMICGGAVLVLLGSGCVFNSREVTVSREESLSQQRDYFRNELVNPDGLALESENFLRGNLMLDDLSRKPQTILTKLNEYFQISGDPKYLIIAADLCRYLATQNRGSEAIRYHLSSFYYCTTYTRVRKATLGKAKTTGYDFTIAQSLQDYNEACCGIFSFLRERKLLDANSVTLHDAEGHAFVMAKPVYLLSVPQEAIEDFSLCASYKVKDLMQMNRKPGIGVPLVAKVKMKKWYKSLKTPSGLTIPVTMMLKRETGPDGGLQLRLYFIDTGLQESLQMKTEALGESNFDMALDFSTPLAVYLSSLAQRNLLGQMLNPFDQEASDGLYMIEPYQPNKIPVVFIHGLMSSPETWVQMINSLKNDPQIRKRYQFWFFSYSTGSPVILSAMKLRNALLAAEKEFCTTPEATANFNNMVLVGHSMGGLLTRLMVQKDSEYMIEKMSRFTWAEIKAKLQPDDFKYLESLMPTPLPFVHRVVFMAVPHKGATMAKSPIAILGIFLIKLPASVLNKEAALKRIFLALDGKKAIDRMRNRMYTGIDNLDPDNHFVKAVGTSPMKDDLVYHSVIGNRSEAGVPGNSDGIVPYWSSHLDNAASELVVKSDHSVHRRPAAIQELLRILLLHLKSVDQKK